MRGQCLAGLGLVAFLGAGSLSAQSPAAVLGRAVPVEDAAVVRAAPPSSLFPSPALKQTAPAQPGSGTTPQPGTGGSNPLGQPRPLDGNPMVTEQRNPGATLGTPTFPYGPQPSAPGVFAPVGGYGSPIYPASNPVIYGGGVPVVAGPQPQPCPPGAVVPQPPMTIAADGGVGVQPRLEDPYWGQGNPLFPRLRNAVSGTLGNSRLTLGGEFLVWFVRAQDAPALLTTSSAANNGIIGQGDTRVIFGNQVLGETRHLGARFNGAYWLTENWALDGNFWFLGKNSGSFTATSDQFPLIGRPFVNGNTGANFSQLIAFPGVASGSGRVDWDTNLWGFDVNFRRSLLCGQCWKVDGLLGFRNMNLIENLSITENFNRTANSPPAIGVPTVQSGTVVDTFRTTNRFYGVNIGLAGEMRRSWWYVNAHAAVGLGSVNQTVEINGFQNLVSTAGVASQTQGGLLALPGANIGKYSQSRFGAMPDVGLNVGVYLTPNLKLGVGYNLMYINSVVRPVGQIDQTLDVTRIPNFPLNPAPGALSNVRPTALPLTTTDFFVQGVTFSLMWTF